MKGKVVLLFSVAAVASVSSLYLRHTASKASFAVQPTQPWNATRVSAAYAVLPLGFEENRGQTDPRVQFLSRGNGYTVFLTGQNATLRLQSAKSYEAPRRPSKKPTKPATSQRNDSVLRLSLLGSNLHPQVEALDPQLGESNYFIGNESAKWRRHVRHFGRVEYHDVYPGTDLVYYGNPGRLESDYVLAAGADPRPIALRIDGAQHLNLNTKGNIVATTCSGDLVLHQPVAYQQVQGMRREVAAKYVARGSATFGIQVGAYDSSLPLVIDPVLAYATYLGGTGQDHGSGIAVDSSGNAYITGSTTSADFPTTAGVVQTRLNCTRAGDAFVTKLNPTGTALVYSTFLGGSCGNVVSTLGGGDIGLGIAIDSSGDAYVTGQTASSDFPTTPTAFQLTNGGGAVFVSKLDPTGTQLLYSTYIHGNGDEYGRAIAVDANGNAYITGITSSTTFPVRAPGGTPFQITTSAPDTAFVCRIDPTQTGVGSLVYSTYLGGSTFETAFGITVDSNANVYVTGGTNSTDFPVLNGFQTSIKSGNLSGNAFLTRLDLNQLGANALIYSTYLGGTGSQNAQENGVGVALDPNRNAYVFGQTPSADFPTTVGAFRNTKKNTAYSSFVARFDTTKSGAASLIYSTYLDGSTDEFAGGIAVDSVGDAFLTGTTASADFPISFGAPQPTKGSGTNAFVTELNPSGSGILFSTFLGGNGLDGGQAIALDTAAPPNVYITGGASSANFPVTPGVFQSTNKSTLENAFVAKLSPGAVTGVFVAPSSLSFGSVNIGTTTAAQTVTLTNSTKNTLTINSITVSGTNAADFTKSATTCGASLAAGANCTVSVTFTPSGAGSESATLTISDSDTSSPQLVSLSGTGITTQPDFNLSVAPPSLNVAAGSSASFIVTVSSVNAFASPVSLSCSGAPKDAACTLNPTSVTPSPNGTGSSNGTLTTTARTITIPTLRLYPRRGPNGLWPLFPILALLLAALCALRRAPKRLAWSFAIALALSQSGCSGVPHPGTPAGAYTLTITGTSGNLTHSVTIALNVS